MLTFIGLGLFDEYDISLKGLEAIREADLVYAEFYTSCLMGTNLEKWRNSMERKSFYFQERTWSSILTGLMRQGTGSFAF